MNGKELLEAYPKIANVIRKWYGENYDYVKSIMDKDTMDTILGRAIDKFPSSLFELFDKIGVYVNISTHKLDEEEDVKFIYYVCPMGDCIESCASPFKSRKDAEYYGMLAAVQYIDDNFDKLFSN